MPEMGFVGPTYVAASLTQDFQECINWYPEIDANRKDRGVIALYPTPGLVSVVQLPLFAEVRGLYTVTGGQTLLAVNGNQLLALTTSYGITTAGTLATSSGPVSMIDNGVTAMIADGTARYSYNWVTNAFAVLADGAFPAATRVDDVDTFMVYNNPGTNQWGCTNAGSSASSALNVSAKDGFSDNLISLIVNQREVYLLGEKTTEVWVNVGAFPFPFQRIPGTSSQHGVAAVFSLARLGNSFAWLSKDDRGQGVVVQMNGYAPQRISTHAVETAITGYATVADARAYTYQQNGHEFYVLNFPSADVTWAYDLATEMWHKRAWRDQKNMLHRHRSNCAAVFNGQIIVGDWQNGKLYAMSLTTFADDGQPLPCIRRAPHLVGGEIERVFYEELQLQFQPGVGLQTGQGSSPQVMLRWSDDGGNTFGNEHWRSLGAVGQYKNRARWTQLGEARDRVFEASTTDPVYRVLVSSNLKASAGAH
jgi:Phage stabilisation protein